MELVNKTPHPIVLRHGGEEHTFSPEGPPARVAVEAIEVGDVAGFPLVATNFGAIEGLPNPQDGVSYIVSAMVLAAAKRVGRHDCVAPDTGPSAVRNQNGRIEAVIRFTL